MDKEFTKLVGLMENYVSNPNIKLTVTVREKGAFYIERIPIKEIFTRKPEDDETEVELVLMVSADDEEE